MKVTSAACYCLGAGKAAAALSAENSASESKPLTHSTKIGSSGRAVGKGVNRKTGKVLTFDINLDDVGPYDSHDHSSRGHDHNDHCNIRGYRPYRPATHAEAKSAVTSALFPQQKSPNQQMGPSVIYPFSDQSVKSLPETKLWSQISDDVKSSSRGIEAVVEWYHQTNGRENDKADADLVADEMALRTIGEVLKKNMIALGVVSKKKTKKSTAVNEDQCDSPRGVDTHLNDIQEYPYSAKKDALKSDLRSSIHSFVRFCQKHLKSSLIVGYKLKLAAYCGPEAGSRCPSWHQDNVPVRWIQSYSGKGCMYVDPLSPEAMHNPFLDRIVNPCKEREVRDGNNRSDWKEQLIKKSGAKPHQVQTGDVVILVGKRWNEVVAVGDKNDSKGDHREAVIHKSPHNIKRHEQRVLLTMDVIVKKGTYKKK